MEEALFEIQSWLKVAEEGDTLKVEDGYLVIYNSFGSEINRICFPA